MVVGVFSSELVDTFSKAMQKMGVKNALVIHGKDGMDEITTADETLVAELKDGDIKKYTLTPEQFGLKRAKKEELLGGDAKTNKEITLSILKGEEQGSKRDIVLLNAAAAIYVSGLAPSVAEGIKAAEKSIDSGKAYKTYESVVSFTNKQSK